MDEHSNKFLAASDPSNHLPTTGKTIKRPTNTTRVTRASTRQLELEAPTVATLNNKSTTDLKGKKRAKPTPSPSPDPESSELSELESEPEPPKKKQRRASASKPKAKALPKPRSKGKGKAKAKMPRKPSAPRTKSAAGPSNDRAKKGDLASFLRDDDMEMDDGDDANWIEDEPSRMNEDHAEDDDDDDDDDDDGPPTAGPSASSGMPSGFSNPFTGGFGGMELDADTAAAIFGGGFRAFGGGGSAISNRLKRLRNDLKSPKSATRLQALQECSEILLVATEDTLAGHFSIEGFSKEFIAILDGKPNVAGGATIENEAGDEDAQLAAALAMSSGEEMPGFGSDAEAQLVACRCLAHLLEALPGTGHVLVHLGAVRVLCSKLKEISYIELAEQTLSTLEKLSQETPSHVVREGGLSALLSFLDFFSTNVQRTAVTAAAHCCKNISSDAYPSIREVFPVLRQVLSYSDQRLVEQATLAVVRTLESYRSNASHLEGLLDTSTVSAINALLIPSGGSPLISSPTYTSLLKVLTTAARASPTVTIAFLEAGMTDTLYQILTGVLPARDESESGQVTEMAVLQNLAHRPKEQVEEALALITELLPPLPKDGVFDSRGYSERALQKLNRPGRSSSKVDATASSSTPKPKRDSEIRTELLKSKPDLVAGFTRSIVPVLVDVFAASVSHRVRYKVLAGLLKAVAFAEPEELQIILNAVPMASFLASIVSSGDNPTFVLCALQLIECLIVKLPQVYHASFHREGVVYEVELLAAQEPQPKPPAVKVEPVEPASTTEEDAKPVIVMEPVKPKVPPTPADLHDANIHRARMLGAKRTFETEDGGDEAAVAMQRLEQLVAALVDEDADEAQLRETLRTIATLFQDADKALSSFELLKSGLVDGLLTFVTMDGKVSQDSRRALLFEAFSAGPSGSPSPLTMLVKRLHESLSRLEVFEVETVKAGREELNRFASSPITRNVRIRLAPEETSDSVKPAVPLAISIQGIAPMQMLHDYIRPRIANGNSGDRGSMAAIMEALAQSGGGSSAATSRLLAALNARGPNGTPDLTALRAALGGLSAPSAAAPSSTGAEGGASGPSSSTQATEGTDEAANKPQTRRSARLSAVEPAAEGSAAADTTASTSALPGANASDPVPLSSAVAALHAGLDMDVDFDDDEEGYSDEEFDHEIFEEGMDDDLPPPPEKTVDMDVAPDGTTVIAKTPDGTRVPTPAQGSSTPAAGSAKQSSYASAVKAPPVDWHLEFRLDGNKLSMADTVYGAIHKYGQTQGDPAAFNVFHSNSTILYRKVPGPAPPVEDDTGLVTSPEPSSIASLPASLTQDGPTAKILRLLSVVHALAADARDLQSDADLDETLFVNNKLTAKLTRQLEETMIVASSCMPDWSVTLPANYPFLFPFETRYSYLQSSAFGNERLLLRWQAAQPRNSSRRDDGVSSLIRLPRNKVRISRTSIFESAAKVLDLYGGGLGILEVEYFDEIGTGLGPTLEFYTLVSKEFARRSLGIWRDEDTAKSGETVVHPKGLFPSPMDAKSNEEKEARLHHFKSLGLFVARALLDSRIIDVNLNRLFLKLVLGHRVPKSFASLKLVDADFARNLEALHSYALARREIQDISALSSEAKTDKLAAITVNGASIADLSLDFTLPGYDIELKPGGKDIAVSDSNVDEYLERILDLTLGSGVEAQVQAFRDGFSRVLSIRDLALFAPEELILLFGNADEDWSRETLEQALKADHGYNSDSRAVKNLLDTMASYDKQTRRDFLQFVTGAPKLPIGGFRGLNPPFTVVRKPHEAPYKADDYLPSVMTCAQYLKMPDYTTREVLETQLGRAMREGGQAFHLS